MKKSTKNNCRFKKNDVVKLCNKFVSYPTAFGTISKRNKKYLPFFAYGNKPNITGTYRVIECRQHTVHTFTSVELLNLAVIQNTDTLQVYIVNSSSLFHKYQCR